jgi:hypothetical protein
VVWITHLSYCAVWVLQDSYLSTSCPHTFSHRVVSRPTSASSLSKSEWGPRWVGLDFSTSRRALCTSSVSWSITICCCDTAFWRFSKSSWTWTHIMHQRYDMKIQVDVRAHGTAASYLTAKKQNSNFHRSHTSIIIYKGFLNIISSHCNFIEANSVLLSTSIYNNL